MKRYLFLIVAALLVAGVTIGVIYYSEPITDSATADGNFHHGMNNPIVNMISDNDIPRQAYVSDGRNKLGKIVGDDTFRMPEYTLSSSIKYDNLEIFFIKTKPAVNGKAYITLTDALVQKKAVVHETSNVNQLNVTNLGDEYLFIHSGDIVKGGKQDRTIQYDVVVEPNEKSEPLASYCVESGRWTTRGAESHNNFAWCSNMISSKELKIAARYDRDQGQVWGNVSEQQSSLNSSMMTNYRVSNADVTRNASASSLQLTLENHQLDSLRNNFHERLSIDLASEPEAVGMAFFINGELYGIDVYNNRQLFADLWYKLLEAAIVEAISNKTTGTAKTANTADIEKIISASYKIYEPEKVNTTTTCTASETADGKVAAFLTEDKNLGVWMHRCWLPLE